MAGKHTKIPYSYIFERETGAVESLKETVEKLDQAVLDLERELGVVFSTLNKVGELRKILVSAMDGLVEKKIEIVKAT